MIQIPISNIKIAFPKMQRSLIFDHYFEAEFVENF